MTVRITAPMLLHISKDQIKMRKDGQHRNPKICTASATCNKTEMQREAQEHSLKSVHVDFICFGGLSNQRDSLLEFPELEHTVNGLVCRSLASRLYSQQPHPYSKAFIHQSCNAKGRCRQGDACNLSQATGTVTDMPWALPPNPLAARRGQTLEAVTMFRGRSKALLPRRAGSKGRVTRRRMAAK